MTNENWDIEDAGFDPVAYEKWREASRIHFQERPYVMFTGWADGIHGRLDGEALVRWAKKLEAILSHLPAKEDIETAMLANGGKENCTCEPGSAVCQWCAIDSVLYRVLRAKEAASAPQEATP